MSERSRAFISGDVATDYRTERETLCSMETYSLEKGEFKHNTLFLFHITVSSQANRMKRHHLHSPHHLLLLALLVSVLLVSIEGASIGFINKGEPAT